jgi:hypothetical protein
VRRDLDNAVDAVNTSELIRGQINNGVKTAAR